MTAPRDWGCFSRRGSMSWDQFLGSSAYQEGVFRVYLRPGNYYNFDFEDRKQHLCFSVDSPDLEKRLYAYAERGSVLAKTIRRTLGKEKGARLMLKLSTAPDQARNRQVRIVDLVAASWIEPERQ